MEIGGYSRVGRSSSSVRCSPVRSTSLVDMLMGLQSPVIPVDAVPAGRQCAVEITSRPSPLPWTIRYTPRCPAIRSTDTEDLSSGTRRRSQSRDNVYSSPGECAVRHQYRY